MYVLLSLEETSVIFSSLAKSGGIYSSIFSISLLGIGSPLQNFSNKHERPIKMTSMLQKHIGKKNTFIMHK